MRVRRLRELALDRQVAVNPLWEQRHLSFQEASARWSALGGFRCLMPARWYRDQWFTSIHPAHLRQAAQEMNVGMPPQELVAALENESSPPVLRLFSACLDQDRQGVTGIAPANGNYPTTECFARVTLGQRRAREKTGTKKAGETH